MIRIRPFIYQGLLALFLAFVTFAGLSGTLPRYVGAQTTQPSTQPTTRPTTRPADTWPDHRPIGVIFLSQGGFSAQSPGYRSAKNPRGWNPAWHRELVDGKPWGPELDVHDPSYAAKFDAAVNAFVLQSYDRAERFGCQGLLFWDVEGSEFDHPVTYIGSGGMILPPELTRARVGSWVKEATRRKLRVGFTYRDTQFAGTPYGAVQATTGDPAAALIKKMQDTRFAYGNEVCIAYCDTLVEEDCWSDGEPHPRPAAVLEKVQRSVPGWLVIPEYGCKDYDAVPRVASLRYQSTQLSPGSLLPSCQSFEVLVPYDGAVTNMQKLDYLRAMKAGSISLVTVTWDSPQTAWVPQLAKAALAPTPTNVPAGPATRPSAPQPVIQ